MSPENSGILLDLGAMYSDNNEFSKALSAYRKALKNGGYKAGIYANIASLYAQNDEATDSVEFYDKKAIEADSRNGIFYFNYGNYFLKQKKYKEAEKQYLTAIQLIPNNNLYYNNLGLTYIHLDDFKKAEETFMKGLEFAPENYNLNLNMATICLNHSQDYPSAVMYATKAAHVTDGSNTKIRPLIIRANARQRIGEYENALYDYFETLNNLTEEEKLATNDIYTSIGYSYLEMNNLELAKKYFEKAINFEKNIDPLIGLMTVTYLSNDPKEYKKAKSEANKLEPSLKKGMDGIKLLESKKHYYSENQKKILEQIFQ